MLQKSNQIASAQVCLIWAVYGEEEEVNRLYALTTSEESLQEADTTILDQLLKDYDDLFQEPHALPPIRLHDHRIPLKEGTQPINVRPYRYPTFQKGEIEKLVAEMLGCGIIQPSASPFSSPVVLVKKKRWNMEDVY